MGSTSTCYIEHVRACLLTRACGVVAGARGVAVRPPTRRMLLTGIGNTSATLVVLTSLKLGDARNSPHFKFPGLLLFSYVHLPCQAQPNNPSCTDYYHPKPSWQGKSRHRVIERPGPTNPGLGACGTGSGTIHSAAVDRRQNSNTAKVLACAHDISQLFGSFRRFPPELLSTACIAVCCLMAPISLLVGAFASSCTLIFASAIAYVC